MSVKEVWGGYFSGIDSIRDDNLKGAVDSLNEKWQQEAQEALAKAQSEYAGKK